MKTKLLPSFALAVGLLTVGRPIFAHHGTAAYGSTEVALKNAVVTKVNWATRTRWCSST